MITLSSIWANRHLLAGRQGEAIRKRALEQLAGRRMPNFFVVRTGLSFTDGWMESVPTAAMAWTSWAVFIPLGSRYICANVPTAATDFVGYTMSIPSSRLWSFSIYAERSCASDSYLITLGDYTSIETMAKTTDEASSVTIADTGGCFLLGSAYCDCVGDWRTFDVIGGANLPFA